MRAPFLLITLLLLSICPAWADPPVPPASRIQSADKPFGVIVDIDDTIRDTLVGSQPSTVSATKRALALKTIARTFAPKDVLVGAPEVLNASLSKASVLYLSNMPKFIASLTDRFFQVAKLPKGPLIVRQNLLGPADNHKFNSIKALIEKNPETRFVLVGDNGEADPLTFKRVTDDPTLREHIAGVYVRQAYPDREFEGIGKEQIPFYTWAELAMRFQAQGIIDEAGAKKALQAVDKALERDPAKVGINAEKVYTSQTKVDSAEVQAALHGIPASQSPELNQAYAKTEAGLERFFEVRSDPDFPVKCSLRSVVNAILDF
jgi:hypothetical protein